MTIEDFIEDIPRELAWRAHSGTSHSPDERADMERTEYASTLVSDYERLAAYAATDEKRGLLASGFARYREGYRSRCLAYLTSRSRCLSSMITGPSRFPVRRNQKRNATADRRLQDMVQFRHRTLDALRKSLDPESRPIMAGDADAMERLKAKLAEAEARQVLMREVNAAIRRHAKEGEAAQVCALIALDPKLDESDARELLIPDTFGRVGFTSYQLTNNNANIHRIKGRIELLSRDKAAAPSTQRGDNGVLYEDCPADQRVRLFFTMIPPVEIRARLKSDGFRWSPWLRCWQAYRTPKTLERAKQFLAPATQPATPNVHEIAHA
jgi:hypothetical protein